MRSAESVAEMNVSTTGEQKVFCSVVVRGCRIRQIILASNRLVEPKEATSFMDDSVGKEDVS